MSDTEKPRHPLVMLTVTVCEECSQKAEPLIRYLTFAKEETAS